MSCSPRPVRPTRPGSIGLCVTGGREDEGLPFLGLCVAVSVACILPWLVSAQGGQAVAIDTDDIGGIVTSAKGPEAGVWVIAETTGLPTKFARIVVTDDQGTVRSARPARRDLSIVRTRLRPGGFAAARIYPASYWWALVELPKGVEQQFVQQTRGGLACHQLGDPATREIPKSLGTIASGLAAWDKRVSVGPSGAAWPAVSREWLRRGQRSRTGPIALPQAHTRKRRRRWRSVATQLRRLPMVACSVRGSGKETRSSCASSGAPTRLRRARRKSTSPGRQDAAARPGRSRSAGLLFPFGIGAHRRSQGRMERSRDVVELFDLHAVACGLNQ